MTFRKGDPKPPGSGRQPGQVNQATADARKAIAEFVDSNAHRLVGWLDRVAEENPAKAFELFQSVIEYHVPKLARTEQDVTHHAGEDLIAILDARKQRAKLGE